MNPRSATLSTGALWALVVSITHVGCDSPTFTGDDPGASDAGDAGAAGSSNPPSISAGGNGEGGSENDSNDAGSAYGGSADAGSADAGAPGDGGASGHDGNGAGGNATGGSENTGGANDAGHAGASGTECDPRWFPADATCVIDERYGVFVSPQGSDATGNGSREAPYGSIARAVASALANDRRVYACADAGVYAESVSIDVAEGLELFGGFSCADWSYDTALKSAVLSGSTRVLRVSVVSGLRFEDFRFEAADAKTAGESSIAAWVVDSSDVMFVRSVLQAGRGAGGTHGGLSMFSGPAPSAMAGNVATGGPNGSPGTEKRCECQTSELASTGGAGGPPGHQAGTRGLPDYGAGRPGSIRDPGCTAKSVPVGNGRDGGNAPDTPPAPGATTLGVADRNGWHPTAGDDGVPGAPGQGGGGGASQTLPGDSRGGGGGCGGCGGNGGQGGRGGGASIALLVLDASVALANSELIASDGGNGGHGSVGQEGQQNTGEGGAGFEGCRGGNGGKGARGGAGGGGAGGISVGVAWSGSDAPLRLDTEIRTGSPGVGGSGGESGPNYGIDGVSQAVLELT